jgi:hypothetical protein
MGGGDHLNISKLPEKPFWWPSSKPYHGRDVHWGELGLKNKDAENGFIPWVHPEMKEYDMDYIDPPVKDGESKYSLVGRDTWSGNQNTKGDKPIPLPQWQKEHHDKLDAVRNIKAKYDISPQHPGFYTWRAMDDGAFVTPDKLGLNYPPGFLNITSTWPRFFDAPINEKCWEKSLACGKYGFMISSVYAFYASFAGSLHNPIIPAMKKNFRRFVPFPTAVGLTWGAGICTAAQCRQKDDHWNPLIASAMAGILTTTRGGAQKLFYAQGLQMFAVTGILGVFWWMQRATSQGLHGTHPANWQWSAPMFWKDYWDQGGDSIPKKNWRIRE